jgi:hypothetical protein
MTVFYLFLSFATAVIKMRCYNFFSVTNTKYRIENPIEVWPYCVVSNLVVLRLCLVRSRRYIVFRDAAARGHHHHSGLVETF